MQEKVYYENRSDAVRMMHIKIFSKLPNHLCMIQYMYTENTNNETDHAMTTVFETLQSRQY